MYRYGLSLQAGVASDEFSARLIGVGGMSANLAISQQLSAVLAGVGDLTAEFEINYPRSITPLNPGAESGTTANWTDDGDTAAPSQWMAVATRMGGLGTVTPDAGLFYFTPQDGIDADVEFYQEVDLTEFATDIDAGGMLFDLSWAEASVDDNNRLYVYAEFRDGPGGTVLDTIQNFVVSPPVEPTILTATWRQASISGLIPTGARTVRYRFRAFDVDNDDENGVALDSISASISEPVRASALLAGVGGFSAEISDPGELIASIAGVGGVSAALTVTSTPSAGSGFRWTVGIT